MPMKRFVRCFSQLPDPRASNTQHDLTELLFIALLATLSGAETCSDMAQFARSRKALLRTVLTLEHGAPSHDTFSRVFRLLDPAAFEKAFRRFMKAFGKAAKIKGVVALDGKSLRRAYERGKSHMPPLMVTAWSAQTRMALANQLAPNNNEAAAALQLVNLLCLDGCVVTADALHCRQDLAKRIVKRGGDYALAVKDNQPGLLADAKAAIAAYRGHVDPAASNQVGHGRKETRTATVAPAPGLAAKHRFAGLAAVARIRSRRGSEKLVERYFLLSKCFKPHEILRIVREHWSIENQLHWTLDVVLDEDLARSRKDNAPVNLAVLRRLALNVARAHPDAKTSMRLKLKRAAWDETFLLELLGHMQ
jgi:predicted transposase YbfD/YdcC